MELSIGFSPCPNDTFIFDALIHQKIDTEGLTFRPVIEDVEALNRVAFAGELDITKLSYHAYAHLLDQYLLLEAGSALGNNCGPLLIGRHPTPQVPLDEASVAIPGRYTTANFLLSLAYPALTDKREMVFSEIEDAVLDQRVDFGLIIHENRFTYAERGLYQITDLGAFWEQRTGLPIPLGGIVIRRNLPPALRKKVNRVLRRSVAFARDQPEATRDFVAAHAQAMDEKVMYQHIELYVTPYTLELGKNGRAAIQKMFDTAWNLGIIPPSNQPLFIELTEAE